MREVEREWTEKREFTIAIFHWRSWKYEAIVLEWWWKPLSLMNGFGTESRIMYQLLCWNHFDSRLFERVSCFPFLLRLLFVLINRFTRCHCTLRYTLLELFSLNMECIRTKTISFYSQVIFSLFSICFIPYFHVSHRMLLNHAQWFEKRCKPYHSRRMKLQTNDYSIFRHFKCNSFEYSLQTSMMQEINEWEGQRKMSRMPHV